MSTTTLQADDDAETCGLRERKKAQTRQAIHLAARNQVLEHGLAGVTVEEICAAAGVSSRTFFNYFPSKADAALDLPVVSIPDDVRARFLAGGGSVVDDLCDLLAATMNIPADRQLQKELVQGRPELVPTMLRWMASLRTELVALAAERATESIARTAVTLVLAAVVELAHELDRTDRTSIAVRLRRSIAALGELARTVRTTD